MSSYELSSPENVVGPPIPVRILSGLRTCPRREETPGPEIPLTVPPRNMRFIIARTHFYALGGLVSC